MRIQTKGRFYLLGAASSLALLSGHSSALAQEAGRQVSDLDTVVVTARRREESLQDTPVAVQVISGEQLRSRGVRNLYDLTSMTPGVNFTVSTSKANPLFSIRGMSRGTIGNAQPSVGTYLNEVPSLLRMSVLPTYDMANVQILKGPQGTLFGRNTTAGAVLVTTNPPTHEFGASAELTMGSYNWRQLNAVLNMPLVAEKVALRLAVESTRRDGYTQVVSFPGKTTDRIDIDNYRASLLLEPIDGLRNLTVFDSHNNYDITAGGVLDKYTPGGSIDNIPYMNGTYLYLNPLTPCNGLPVCDIRAAYARQLVAGKRKIWSEIPSWGKVKARSWTNTTTYDLGFATLKNIFGYRRNNLDSAGSLDGLEFVYYQTNVVEAQKQYSNETQLSGEAFGGNLNWLTGAFWVKSKPAGPLWNLGIFFVPTNVTFAQAGTGTSVFTTDESKAAFAQINYKFGGVSEALSGVSTDLGIRYTKDKQSVCSVIGVRLSTPMPKASDCPATLDAKSSSSKVTYTVGLNWQVNEDLLTYVAHRRGYRSSFSNAPRFGGLLVPFQGVKPETVDDIELGLKSTWRLADRPGRFNIAAYDSRYKGLQQVISINGIPATGPGSADGDNDATNNPFSQSFYANIGDAKVKGIEIDAAFSPVDGLELAIGAAWLDKKITKITLPTLPPAFAGYTAPTPAGLAPIAFAGAPDYSFTASADYTLPLAAELGKVTASLRFFRTSKVRNVALTAPPYNKWDASIDWRGVMGSDVDLGVFVNNITNIATPTGPHISVFNAGINSVFYTEPRMVGVRLRYAMGSER